MSSLKLRSALAFAALSLSLLATGCKDKLVGISATIQVTPTTLAFGQASVGSAQQIRVSVSNIGSSPLQISAIKVASDPNNELTIRDLLTTDCNDQAVPGSTTLNPGDCARFTVRWTSSGQHAAAGSVEIDSNDPANSVVTLPVTGNATAPTLQYCVLSSAGAVVPSQCSDFTANPIVEPPVDFGNSLPGVASTRTVRVSNQGQATLTFLPQPSLSPTGSTDFSLSGTIPNLTLAPGASADLTVSVNPSTSGAISTTLNISSNDLNEPQLAVPVTINVPAWKLCIDPAGGLNFGVVAPGQTSTKTLTFTNCGAVDFTVNSFTFVPTAPTTTQFTYPANAFPAALSTFAVGTSIPVDVTYTPTALQNDAAAINYSFAVGGITVQGSAPIIGGSSGPIISVTPMTLAFGSISIGSPQQIRVSVSNIGSTPLLVSNIKVATDPNSELSVTDLLTTDCNDVSRSGGMTLVPGECARFTVAWAPTAAHAAAGSIEIDSNDLTHGVVTLPVTGDAVAPPLLQVCVLDSGGNVVPAQCSDLSASPHVVPSVNFGSGLLNTASSLKVRLTNQGTAALNFSPQPNLDASSSANYTLAGSVPGASLAAGATADLTVTVTPTTSGQITGALDISSNDLRAPTLQLPMLITVAGPAVCITPGTGLAFGALSIGQTATQTITFKNCGGSDFTVNSFTFAATSPTTTQFTITSGTLPAAGTIFAAGASVALNIMYKPSAVQNDAAAISYSLSTAGVSSPTTGSAPITGNGTAPACGSSGLANPSVVIATYYSTDQSGSGTYTSFNPATTPSPVIPLDYVKLDGSGSTVSTGSPIYTWQLTSQPAGSTTALSSTNGPTTQMQTLVSGTYVVQLNVKDTNGCSSTSSVTIQVVPVGAIHIELTWAEDCGDLDIHYVPPGGSICDGNDLFYEDLAYYGGTFPDWGCSNGSCNGAPSDPGGPYPDGTISDDATLDHDNTTGYGPENVTQKLPFDSPSGTPYQVWVYYYDDHSNCAATHPTVKVYINGVYAPGQGYVLTGGMTYHQRWHALDINVANQGTSISVAPVTGANFSTVPGPCNGEVEN